MTAAACLQHVVQDLCEPDAVTARQALRHDATRKDAGVSKQETSMGISYEQQRSACPIFMSHLYYLYQAG